MERYQVEHLRVSQALRGVVTSKFHAVWFDIGGDQTEIYIALIAKGEAERQAIAIFEENYGALVENSTELFSVHTSIICDDTSDQFDTSALVFLRCIPTET